MAINICDFKPESLPPLSRIKSEDPVWYFFSPREFLSTKKTVKKKVRKRTTPSGFWKPTGVDQKIKDRRGNGDEIGIKKTLVYHEGKAANGVRTPWVMNEYQTSEDEILSLRKYSCKDIQTPAETFINRKTRESHFTRRTIPSKQEVKECKSKAVDASMDKKSPSSMVKTEKKGRFITEEAKQRIRRISILVAVIGNIISVLLSVKT